MKVSNYKIFTFDKLYSSLDKQLQEKSFRLESSLNSIENFLIRLQKEQPEHILGLGFYTGRDQDKIRIETRCTNKFRNKSIEAKFEFIEMETFIKPNMDMQYGYRMGNSWCNLVSYKIMKLIRVGKLRSKYTFLHVPSQNIAKLENFIDTIEI